MTAFRIENSMLFYLIQSNIRWRSENHWSTAIKFGNCKSCFNWSQHLLICVNPEVVPFLKGIIFSLKSFSSISKINIIIQIFRSLEIGSFVTSNHHFGAPSMGILTTLGWFTWHYFMFHIRYGFCGSCWKQNQITKSNDCSKCFERQVGSIFF